MDSYGNGIITADVIDKIGPAYLITGSDDTWICRDETRNLFKLGDQVSFGSYPIGSPTDFPHVSKGASNLTEIRNDGCVEGVPGDRAAGIVCSIRNYDPIGKTWKTNFFPKKIVIKDIKDINNKNINNKNAFVGTRVLFEEKFENGNPTGVWNYVKIVAPPESKREMKGLVMAEDLGAKKMAVFVPGMPSYFYFPLKSGINAGLGRWISFTINEEAAHDDHFVYLEKELCQTAAPSRSKSLQETEFKMYLKCSRRSKNAEISTSTGDVVTTNSQSLDNILPDQFANLDLWITFRRAISDSVFLYVTKNQPQLANYEGSNSSATSITDGSEKSVQGRDTRSPPSPHVGNSRQPQPEHRRTNVPNSEHERDFSVETRWIRCGKPNPPLTPPHQPANRRFSNQAPQYAPQADNRPQHHPHNQRSTCSPNNALNSPHHSRSPPRNQDHSPPRNGINSQQDIPFKKPQRVISDQTSSNTPTFNFSPRVGRSPDRCQDNQLESKRSRIHYSKSPPRNSKFVHEKITKPARVVVAETDSSSNRSSSPGNSLNTDSEITELRRQLDEMKRTFQHHNKYKAVYDMMKRVLVDDRFHNAVKSYNPALALDLHRAVNE